MGTYFNPGNESFCLDIRGQIYVDKTGLLEILNRKLGTPERCIALSHARRFGKSQAAGMIDAYYSIGSDSRELFSKFEIAGKPDFEEHLNKYNVIHLDMSAIADFYKEDLVSKTVDMVYNELREDYPDLMDRDNPFGTILMQVYKESGRQFVIIIDEWDCVVRNHSDRPDLVHAYLQFLHSLFKSEESKHFLALAYITGILPIKKIKDESALNNFFEYTMLSSKKLTKYFGFTEEEVRALCSEYHMDFDSVRQWYDGYLIDGLHMYNPNSVYRAMTEGSLEPYWKNTSSFASINDYITLNYDGLKEAVLTMLEGGRAPVDVMTFGNDLSVIESKDEALTALIHLGYLAYDAEMQEAYIPNYEVALAYRAALKKGSWSEVARAISRCDEILRATIDKDAAKVAEILEESHETYTSILNYNDENSLSCAITMAYFTAPAYYNVIRELPAGKGFADIALIPRADSKGKPAMIIELKWNKDADSAIRQIKEKRYAGSLKGYGDEVLLVGVSYNKEAKSGSKSDDSDAVKHKKHECVIESIMLQ